LENLSEFLMKSHWYFDKNSVRFTVAEAEPPTDGEAA
jgi:hypothetical protein